VQNKKKKRKNDKREEEDDKDGDKHRDDVPNLSQVLDWVCTCLDSHFTDTTLLSEPNVVNLLKQFAGVCDVHLKCCEKMETVHGMVGALVEILNNKVAAVEKPIGDYAVELFAL